MRPHLPFLAVLLLAAAAAVARAATPCGVELNRTMNLSEAEFDQLRDGGWRMVAAREGCTMAAADLIRSFRRAHRSASHILYWHEGQLRALAGDAEAGAALFAQARQEQAKDRIGWNLYVDASIAFLRGDRAALLAARDALAALPKPEGWGAGSPNAAPWPLNLDVVERLVACFGQGYREAYTGCGTAGRR
jgi:hypothetical protein